MNIMVRSFSASDAAKPNADANTRALCLPSACCGLTIVAQLRNVDYCLLCIREFHLSKDLFTNVPRRAASRGRRRLLLALALASARANQPKALNQGRSDHRRL